MLPESPVWLVENGEDFNAMQLLKRLKDPVRLNEFLLTLRNETTNYYDLFMELLGHFGVYTKSQMIFFIIMLAPMSCIHYKTLTISLNLYEEFGYNLYQYLSALMEIPIFIFSAVMLYLFNRKHSITLTYFTCAMTYFIAYVFETNRQEWPLFITLLITDIQTGDLLLIGLLYTAENTPITQRCAGIGFTTAIGKILPTFAMVWVGISVTRKELYFTASVMSFVGGLTMIGAYVFMKDISRPHMQ